MYMFTFVFMLVVILGLFGQVYFTQVTEANNRQTVAGKQVLAWHESAVRFARGAAGLSFPDLSAGGSACRITPNAFIYADEVAAGQAQPTDCGVRMSSTDLPSGMSATTITTFRFETVVYANPPGSSTGSRYVMTYVPRHPTDGQAPRAPTGFRMMDVAAQLSRSLPLGANLNAGAITSSTTPGQCELRRVMDTAGGTPASLTTTYRVPTQAGICLAQPGSVAVFTLL